jgi:[glutamine synthetase] adenylyltransferase / [glutamine synthetase]-adenylyl-L-tyrosine phosphorylase
MPNPVWSKALQACADPARARRFFEHLQAAPAAAASLAPVSAEQARILASLFSGSQVLGEWLLNHPEWIASTLQPDLLQHPRRDAGLRREVRAWFDPLLKAPDPAPALSRLRQWKQREMLRIAARDLARLGRTVDIIREISDVADICLEALVRFCRRQLGERFGEPHHLDADGRWQPTEFCMLGMGKLGGQELNYSSDIDLLFVYSDEGFTFKTPPARAEPVGRGQSNHQYFQRLVEALVAELTKLAPEGALYRVDLRLRPEGEAGPPARSLSSYENYYAQWGQTWERMMLIKARGVAGDASLAAEFLEMVQPFRYPRSLGERIVREIADMKDRLENEVVKSGELDRNVKLGRGGIREIEFVVQTQQLLHAGRTPFLQNAQTLPALDKLVEYRLLPRADARGLSEAYCFLRDLEHRLQMENNLQTHTLPAQKPPRERIARLMGFDSLREFETALRDHTGRVRRVYAALLESGATVVSSGLPREVKGNESAWHQILTDHSFRQVEKSLKVLQTLVHGPGYGHVSPRTVDLAMQLVTRLLSLCPKREADRVAMPPNALSDPDRVLARLDTYIAAYGARAMLYEAWTGNPSLFELLVLLFDRSEFLAETAIRTPDLVDDLAASGQLRRRKNAIQILQELQLGRADDDQRLWLRRYHQAEFMRIGLRDILGLADFEQNLVELSGLADACLRYALEIVSRRHQRRKPPFAILGLGKLGGTELTYGSDLDLTFVASSGTRDSSRLQRLAAEVMDLLSGPTEFGVAFVTDARLRPDGEKGLLVNTLAACEEYYRHRAQLWELQALSRSRPVAGDAGVGARFQQLTATICNLGQPSLPLVAYRPDWKAEIARMRARIERERTPPGRNPLAIKTGTGGLMDAEFLAQTLCLAHGWQEPNTLRAIERAREAGALAAADADRLIDHYRRLRRVEGILRRWSFEGETVLPDDPAPLYRVSVRCGFPDAEAFMRAVAEDRAAIRGVYEKVLATPSAAGCKLPGASRR